MQNKTTTSELIEIEDECEHDDVDPMEGCLDCGAPYHEVRNTDPDTDMER